MAFFQASVHDVKAALAAALRTNDQAVIDPTPAAPADVQEKQ